MNKILSQPSYVKISIERRRSLSFIYNRLSAGDSCALVGPSHIGKTSLLKMINQKIDKSLLQGSEICLLFFDCHTLPSAYQPADFFGMLWKRLLREFPAGPHISVLHELLAQPTEPWLMPELFTKLSMAGRRVVLLLDEFDALLSHPRFHQAEFFGPLRSLSSTTDGGLVLVTASRLSMAEMNRRSERSNPSGSPFFNTKVELRLYPFEPAEVDELLDHAALSAEERVFVCERAGNHPFLLQSAVSAVHEARDHGPPPTHLERASLSLRHQVATYCADQWYQLSPDEQRVLLTLAKDRARVGEAAPHELHPAALARLIEDGVIEAQRCRIRAGVFVDWLAAQSVPVTPATPAVPLRAALRQRLQQRCPADADLDALGMDHFPAIKRRFTAGMDRTTKENLLLELADPHELDAALCS